MSDTALAIADPSGLVLKASGLRDGEGILTASANKYFVGAAPLGWKWSLSFLCVGQENEGGQILPSPFSFHSLIESFRSVKQYPQRLTPGAVIQIVIPSVSLSL